MLKFFNMHNNKMKRTTNRAQFIEMIRQMKDQPDIAKNLSKTCPEVVQEFWKQLQNELNALGPPVKVIAEWKKVWSDYKSSLRKKLTLNEIKSDGTETHVLITPLDEEVIQLIGLRNTEDSDLTPHTFKTSRKRTSFIEDDTRIRILNVTSQSQSEELQTVAPKQIKLIGRHVEVEQNLFNTLDKLSKTNNRPTSELNFNTKRIARAVEKLGEYQKQTNDLLQAQLDESKRHNHIMEQLALKKHKRINYSNF